MNVLAEGLRTETRQVHCAAAAILDQEAGRAAFDDPLPSVGGLAGWIAGKAPETPNWKEGFRGAGRGRIRLGAKARSFPFGRPDRHGSASSGAGPLCAPPCAPYGKPRPGSRGCHRSIRPAGQAIEQPIGVGKVSFARARTENLWGRPPRLFPCRIAHARQRDGRLRLPAANSSWRRPSPSLASVNFPQRPCGQMASAVSVSPHPFGNATSTPIEGLDRPPRSVPAADKASPFRASSSGRFGLHPARARS